MLGKVAGVKYESILTPQGIPSTGHIIELTTIIGCEIPVKSKFASINSVQTQEHHKPKNIPLHPRSAIIKATVK